MRGLLRLATGRSSLGTRTLLAYDRWFHTGRLTTWAQVADLLAVSPAATVGVDVFDTVLSRRVVGDASLWWIVGTHLVRTGGWRGSVEDFVRIREAAGDRRPTDALHDVYEEPELAERCLTVDAAATEQEVEDRLSVALAGAREALDRVRAAGHRLVFVSDMHLAHAGLWATLTRHRLAASGDRLVVSSAVGAAKWDGTLFPQLASSEDVRLTWHVGNDLWGDVAMAERAGVGAVPLRRGEPTEFEEIMSDVAGSAGSAIAGAAVQVRVAAPAASPVGTALYEVGVDVAGQTLAAFLLWVREQCEQVDAHDVRFLARDGELPLRMAQAMPVDHWDGFSLTYLHGTRRLWSLAAASALGLETWLAAGTGDARGFLRQGENELPWGSVLGRVALTPSDLLGFAGLDGLAPGLPLPQAVTPAWHAALQDRALQRVIAARADQQHADLVEYLASQGVRRGRVALVDVGWRGQLAWHMSAVLRDLTRDEPVHLHFGGVDVATSQGNTVDIRRFAVDDSRAPLPFPDVVSCVETFTASGGPRARAVERDPAGGVRPVFEPPVPSMDTAQRRTVWAGAVDLAAALPSRSVMREWGLTTVGLEGSVCRVLAQFWMHPTSSQALAASHLAAEVDDAGIGVHPVAQAYGLSRQARSRTRTWRQGSLALTPVVLRAGLRVALRLRDLRLRSWA